MSGVSDRQGVHLLLKDMEPFMPERPKPQRAVAYARFTVQGVDFHRLPCFCHHTFAPPGAYLEQFPPGILLLP